MEMELKSVIIIAIALVLLIPLSISAQSQGDIPSWVKNNAVWWGEDKISDSEFLSALQYLINNGHLKVVNSSEDVTELEKELQSMKELKDKYQQSAIELKAENNKLKREIGSQNSQDSSQSSSSYNSVQDLKAQSVSWDYKDILRNEDKYLGKIIYLTGSIDSISKNEDDGNWVELFVQTNPDGYFYPDAEYFYVWYDGSRLLNDDTIEAYVEIDSIHEAYYVDWQYYPVVISKHLTCTSC
jgi:hypothetical protein